MQRPHLIFSAQWNLTQFLWKYLKNKYKYIIVFAIVAIIWSAEMFLSPYLLKVIIDTINVHSHNQESLVSTLVLPVILYISTSLAININFRLYDYACLKLYPKLKAEITKDMYSYLIKHSYSFFQSRFAGSLARKISDMTTNIEAMLRLISEAFVPVLCTLTISSTMLLITVHWVFAVTLILWSVVFVGLSYLATKKLKGYSESLAELSAATNGRISESISAITSIKLFGAYNHETHNISSNLESVIDADYKMHIQNMKINFVQGVSITIFIILMLNFLLYGYLNNIVTIGDFALVLGVSISIVTNVHNIGRQMQQFAVMYGECKQALTIMQEAHEIFDIKGAKPLKVKDGLIEFKSVSFNYPDNSTLFHNLSIKILPGEKIGLVGYSGGGKSTFIKLILRLIEPQSGSISIDNQNVKKVTMGSLTDHITVIPQNPEMLNRSIADNIKFAKPQATTDEVMLAAKKARCHDFITALSDGYNTLVGERGVKLSGGQIQRLSISRAFLKDSSILLFDEPTSALDSVTEREIQKSLQELMNNKTTIVIAHRLSTLQNLDRILVFEDGKIVEDGDLDRLAKKKNGVFAKFWKMQMC